MIDNKRKNEFLRRMKLAHELTFNEVIYPRIYKYDNIKFMWSDAIYKEWFEYSKLPCNLPSKLAYEFDGYDSADDWWDPKRLMFTFGEPLKEKAVSIISKDDNRIDISINLNYDKHRIIEKVVNILNEAIDTQDPITRSNFYPSKPMKLLRLDKLQEARQVYTLHLEGLSNLEIAHRMDFLKDRAHKILTSDYVYEKHLYITDHKGVHTVDRETFDYEDYIASAVEKGLKRVTRHIKAVQDTLKNMEKGTFP